MTVSGKQARWERLRQLEQADLRWALGYGADAHRIKGSRPGGLPIQQRDQGCSSPPVVSPGREIRWAA